MYTPWSMYISLYIKDSQKTKVLTLTPTPPFLPRTHARTHAHACTHAKPVYLRHHVVFMALTATNCWKERWCLPYWVLCFGELSTIFLNIRWMYAHRNHPRPPPHNLDEVVGVFLHFFYTSNYLNRPPPKTKKTKQMIVCPRTYVGVPLSGRF